jgi:di/tricarboxylate transporter
VGGYHLGVFFARLGDRIVGNMAWDFLIIFAFLVVMVDQYVSIDFSFFVKEKCVYSQKYAANFILS